MRPFQQTALTTLRQHHPRLHQQLETSGQLHPWLTQVERRAWSRYFREMEVHREPTHARDATTLALSLAVRAQPGDPEV